MDIKVRDDMKYKIGEFSKITGIPVKTLRYYDEIDLFKPSEIDLYSGYRYYKKEQIETLKIILELNLKKQIDLVIIITQIYLQEQ